MDPKKIQAISDWQALKNVSELRSLLGRYWDWPITITASLRVLRNSKSPHGFVKERQQVELAGETTRGFPLAQRSSNEGAGLSAP